MKYGRDSQVPARLHFVRIAALAAAFALPLLNPVTAQAQGLQKPLAASGAAAAEQGARWTELKPAQQAALKPLESEWTGIDAQRKQKWLEIAARFPKLSTDERNRIQARMSAWAMLSPQERGQARINFQEAKQLPATDRKARWDAYQALSPAQKSALTARSTPPAASGATYGKAASSPGRGEKSGRDSPQTKSNIVPNPALAQKPKAVSPSAVQIGPGATTTSMTKRATPPSHQQPGLPKIAATPEFVNKSTLLPQRGPQGAATRSTTTGSEPALPKQP